MGLPSRGNKYQELERSFRPNSDMGHTEALRRAWLESSTVVPQ